MKLTATHEWLTLRRVLDRRVCLYQDTYFDSGYAVPAYVHESLIRLREDRLVVVGDGDRETLRRVEATAPGIARFKTLEAKRLQLLQNRAHRAAPPRGAEGSGPGCSPLSPGGEQPGPPAAATSARA